MAADRVSTLELFFDLIFVFTITQVARVVSASHGAAAVGHAALILTIAWWMYGGYAWLTNNIGTEGLGLRLWMLAGMGAYFVMALSIPRAMNEDGLVFGLCFAGVMLVHGILFTRAANSSARAIYEIAPYNALAALCTIGAAFIVPDWRWLGWLAAVLVFVAATFRRREQGFQINAAHFAERHGLIIIITLGESVVALATGIDRMLVRWPLIQIVLLGLALCAAVWWSYFDGDDERGARALSATPADRRSRLAMFAYSDAHLGMMAGIVGIAAGLHDAVGVLGAPFDARSAWILSGGVALYLISDKVFRFLLRVGNTRWRSAAAVIAVVAAPIGWRWSSAAQISALVATLIAMLVIERKTGASSV